MSGSAGLGWRRGRCSAARRDAGPAAAAHDATARLRRLAMARGGAGSTTLPAARLAAAPGAHVTLAEHAAAFEEHGPVRDLYVLDTTSGDWQRLLDHPARQPPPSRLPRRRPAPTLPPRPAEIFATTPSPTSRPPTSMSTLAATRSPPSSGRRERRVHMFPELIDTEQRDQALMAFLVELATVTGKPGGCSAWRKTSRNRCCPTTLTRRPRPTVAIHGRTSAPIRPDPAGSVAKPPQRPTTRALGRTARIPARACTPDAVRGS